MASFPGGLRGSLLQPFRLGLQKRGLRIVLDRGNHRRFRDQALAVPAAASPTRTIRLLQGPYCRSLAQGRARCREYLAVDFLIFPAAVPARFALATFTTSVAIASNSDISIQTTAITIPVSRDLSIPAIIAAA